MSREVLDMAVPINLEAINAYYQKNKENILKSASSSTINSITNDYDKELEMCECASETSSDSEVEDNHNKITKISKTDIENALKQGKLEQKTTDNVDNVHNNFRNIQSVAVNNSTDVHFGNKTFFTGPVIIKHIVVNNDENDSANRLGLGNLNQGFEGSLNNLSQKHSDNGSEKRPDEVNKEVEQDYKQINNFANLISRRKILCLVVASVTVITISIAVILMINYIKDDAENDKRIEIISRNQWNAQPAKETLDDLELPLRRVIICHTVTSKCDTKDECLETVKGIQELHFSEEFRFSDIGYNFLIGGDGNIYEGRGWYKQGAHTSGYNRGSLGIAYIGNFVSKLPNEKQLAAGFRLFAEGLKLGVLSNDYVIYGASQLRNTESPGEEFLNLIKTWPHSFQGV